MSQTRRVSSKSRLKYIDNILRMFSAQLFWRPVFDILMIPIVSITKSEYTRPQSKAYGINNTHGSKRNTYVRQNRQVPGWCTPSHSDLDQSNL